MARQIVVDIIGDETKLKKSFDNAAEHGNKFGSIMTGIGVGMGMKVFDTLDMGLEKSIDFMKGSVDAASDLNETMSKVGVVFGDQGAAMIEWAQNSATAMGMSKNEALSAAGTYGNLFVSMGMTTQKSKEMSQGLVGLAGDLASFNNLSPDEVLEKLRSGLTGETEPLKSLGININDATLKAKAMEMGLVKTSVSATELKEKTLALKKAQEDAAEATKKYGKGSLEAQIALNKVNKAQEDLDALGQKVPGTLDAQTKAMASYALIMEQTKTAQGDFARTSDGLANQQRIAAAKLEDAQAKIGAGLMQVGQVAMPILVNALEEGVKIFDQVSAALAPVVEFLQDAFYVIQDVISGDPFGVLGDDLAEGTYGLNQMGAAGQALGVVLQAIPPAIKFIQDAIAAVTGAFTTITSSFQMTSEQGALLGQNVSGIGQTFQSVFANIQVIVQGVLTAIQTFWQTWGADIMKVVSTAFTYIQETINNALQAVRAIFDIFAGIFQGDWNKVWNGILSLVDAIWKQIGSVVKFAVTGLIPAAIDAGGKLISGAIGAVMNTAKAVVQGAWDAVTGIIRTAWNGVASWLSTAWDNLVKNITGLPGRITSAASGMWDGIWQAFRSAINSIIRGWNSLQFTLPSMDLGPLGKVGGWTVGTPNIPYLHQGGTVPGVPGTDVLAMLQAGERVVPMKQAGSGATEIHIHIDRGAYIDGPSIDWLTREIAQRLSLAGAR